MSPKHIVLVTLLAAGCTPGETSSDSSATSVQCPAHIGDWPANVSYAAGALVEYKGVGYRCVEPHTSVDTSTPGAVPALWESVPCSGTVPQPSIPPSSPPSCST